jgi:hypothetical protein
MKAVVKNAITRIAPKSSETANAEIKAFNALALCFLAEPSNPSVKAIISGH